MHTCHESNSRVCKSGLLRLLSRQWGGQFLQLCPAPPPSPVTAASSKQQFPISTAPTLSLPSAFPSDTTLWACLRWHPALGLHGSLLFWFPFLVASVSASLASFFLVSPFGGLESWTSCSYSAVFTGNPVYSHSFSWHLAGFCLSWAPDPAHPLGYETTPSSTSFFQQVINGSLLCTSRDKYKMFLNSFLMWFKVLNFSSTLKLLPFHFCHLAICEAPLYHLQPLGETQPCCLLPGSMWGFSPPLYQVHNCPSLSWTKK